MSMWRMRREAGDTIIEVLISVVVVSSVLVSAFAVVNKTSQYTIQNQEHNVALKILEGQMERLKIASVDPGSDMYTYSKTFCMGGANDVKKNDFNNLPAADDKYDSECIQPAPVPYHIFIKRGTGSSVDTFTATAVWDGVTGSQDQVQIVYKLFKPGP